MKKVKIMLSAILVMAIVAGALAFKAKKINPYCLYQTTTFTTTVGGTQFPTCKTLGEYITVAAPAGAVKNQVFTTTEPCINVPVSIELDNCVRALRVTIE